MLAAAMSLPLLIEERQGLARWHEPVTVGLPLPQGAGRHLEALLLCDQKGEPCPCQSQVLARWCDGSLRWVLLDFQANVGAHESVNYHLHLTTAPTVMAHTTPLTVHQAADGIQINTGSACFTLSSQVCKPLSSMQLQGRELLAPGGSQIVVTDEAGQEYVLHIAQMHVALGGPLRVVVSMQGDVRRADGVVLAQHRTRLSFYAGHHLMQMQLTLRNPRAAQHPGGLWDLGDAGSIFLQDVALHLPIAAHTGLRTVWMTHPEQSGMTHEAAHLTVYQDSSGGDNWQSSNHVNRFGEVKHTFSGYRVTADGVILEEGKRATPVLALCHEQWGVAATIDKFWQNFPKALEVRHNQLIARLFPPQYNDVHELQGGEQKTHTVSLLFSDTPEHATDLGWLHARLRPRTTPEWYVQSRVFSYLTPYSHDRLTEGLPIIETAIKGANSFFARREIIDEYGWRHFGEVYADHEAVGHTGATPLISHYNNQYDMICGALIHYVRSGDERWVELAQDCAQHVIDIDIYHTASDRPAYNGGLFWHSDHYTDAATATHRTFSRRNVAPAMSQSYGGGPANEHNYTTGLLYYYYLTGDDAAREAVQGLADWVIHMDDGSQRLLGRLDRRPTGLCSSTVHRDYHGPGRGAGNSINALLDAHLLTQEPSYLAKAEQLIQRCIHPKDNIQAHGFDDVEYRWSYTVFLQVLGKYLALKHDMGTLDYLYSYARASLLHYATWMLQHEVPYTHAFARVKIPTETWPAQDVRKSHVFYLAAQYSVDLGQRRAFEQRAAFFFETCLQDVQTFSTCTLARPLIVLLTNAYVSTYFQRHLAAAPLLPEQPYDFGHPHVFTPQFAEIYWLRDKLQHARVLLRDVRRGLLCLGGQRG